MFLLFIEFMDGCWLWAWFFVVLPPWTFGVRILLDWMKLQKKNGGSMILAWILHAFPWLFPDFFHSSWFSKETLTSGSFSWGSGSEPASQGTWRRGDRQSVYIQLASLWIVSAKKIGTSKFLNDVFLFVFFPYSFCPFQVLHPPKRLRYDFVGSKNIHVSKNWGISPQKYHYIYIN